MQRIGYLGKNRLTLSAACFLFKRFDSNFGRESFSGSKIPVYSASLGYHDHEVKLADVRKMQYDPNAQPLFDPLECFISSYELDDCLVKYVIALLKKNYKVDFNDDYYAKNIIYGEIIEAKAQLFKQEEVEISFEIEDFDTQEVNRYVVKLVREKIMFPSQVFSAYDFLKEAEGYLKRDPHNVTASAELIWGGISLTIAEYYAKIGIGIRSHNALGHLCRQATEFSGDLREAFINGEKCHRAFYRDSLDSYEVCQYLGEAYYFVEHFPKLDDSNFKELFNQFLNDKEEKKLEEVKELYEHLGQINFVKPKNKFSLKLNNRYYKISHKAGDFKKLVTKPRDF